MSDRGTWLDHCSALHLDDVQPNRAHVYPDRVACASDVRAGRSDGNLLLLRRTIKLGGAATALLLFALAPRLVEARLMPNPPSHEELFKRSDLVVVASPTGATHDTAEESVFSGVVSQDSPGHQSPVKAIGVETPFRIAAVLKGPPLTQFVLHHYRTDGPPGRGDPLTLSFGQGEEEGSQRDPKGQENKVLLLFLNREPDGRYAPAGGQTDPAITSVAWLPCVRFETCTASPSSAVGLDEGRALPSPAPSRSSTVARVLDGSAGFLAGVLAALAARWFRRRGTAPAGKS